MKTNIDIRNRLNKLGNKIENNLDFTFKAETKFINSTDDFEENLFVPFKNGERIFYRGERKNSIHRPLIPSLYRKRELFDSDGAAVTVVDCNRVMDVYRLCPEYMDMYQNISGQITSDNIYDFFSFSQHYYGVSPLLDFSKSLYVSLSFALKDRKNYDDDILLYTIKIKNSEDYTDNIEIANKWIRNYSVLLFNSSVSPRQIENPLEMMSDYRNIYEKFKGESFLDMVSPTAKLIDVPTNDLMMFQQGVFLLLDDFTLVGKSYFTKKIRDDFKITKWIISSDICPHLLDLIISDRPYYMYKNITDLDAVVKEVKNNTSHKK